ncbi:hypothetical protein VaNZ11_001232 [Volvox africanus]|uniref:Dynein regulatory complex protein 12 n=1 Tax=Volvox africanus TaxID=51714 RepID=A0ABQ5RP88_9CHLO|nr:hypothetical protein VaNZ11_001232 [Volvox africanus]
MPPKKKNDLAKAAKMADKENLARAETEILSLQHLLELRSHEALEARRSERMWRERMDAFSQSIEQQKEDTLDITADMMRQYKGMQEQLLKKVADLEAENRQLKKTIEERDSEIAKIQMEKEQQKRASDLEVGVTQLRGFPATFSLSNPRSCSTSTRWKRCRSSSHRCSGKHWTRCTSGYPTVPTPGAEVLGGSYLAKILFTATNSSQRCFISSQR